MINTCVSDIYDTDKKNIIVIDLEIWSTYTDELLDTYDIELDLDKMNIDSDSDYMFQLSKDLDRYVVAYYCDKGIIPSIKQIKEEFENRNYISMEV